MYLFGTDFYIHEQGIGSTHKHIDLYKSGVAWVNKAKAISDKRKHQERDITFEIDWRDAGVLKIKSKEERLVHGKPEKKEIILHVISQPFCINVIEEGEEVQS
jgi:hypothetical protein